MKNQGFWITRAATLALSIALFIYMGYHITDALDEPLQTVTAVRITTPHTTPVSGVVVRRESAVMLPAGLVAFSVDEGAHVSTGQTLALSYQTAEGLHRTLQIRELESRLSQLKHIRNQSAGVTDIARMDASIRESLATALLAAQTGQPSLLSRSVLELRSLLFRQEHSFEGEEILSPMIDGLEAEIAGLKQGLETASGILRADSPGLFSASTDGLEEVWTESTLDGLTVERFRSLSSIPSEKPSDNKGKLVRGWDWYYVCLLPTGETGAEGQSRNIRFADGITRSMKIRSISEEEDGQCVVVFTANRYLSEILNERKTDAEIVWNNFDGVRVPHNGLRIEEGQHFVYCLVLGRVVRKDVRTVAGPESDTYYLCAFEPDLSGALLPGDEIIISGKGLYAGKIIG